MRRLINASSLLIAIICIIVCPGSYAKTLPRIALLSDPHVNRATNGTDATFRAHFEKTIADVNAQKVDLAVITGDLTQGGKHEELKDFKAMIKKLNCPVFYVPGNHDVGHKFNSGAKNGTVTIDRVAAFEKELGPSFYAKDKAGVRLIGVDSSLFGSGFDREKQMWQFLEKELSKRSRKPTVLFMHYPLFVKNVDEPGGVYWNVEPEPRKRLLALLEQGGVKTVLTGHLHKDLVNHHNGILFISTRPISFGIPRDKQPEGWTLVTLHNSAEATYELRKIE